MIRIEINDNYEFFSSEDELANWVKLNISEDLSKYIYDENLESENRKLEEKNSELEWGNEDLETDLRHLEDKYDDLKNEVKKLANIENLADLNDAVNELLEII